MERNGQWHRILVVDDDPLSARCVATWLANEGYATARAASGEEAMRRLVEERFTAVVSDVQMPAMNGLELLQQVHAHFPHLPVILMTAFLGPGTREAGLARGATAVLEKPLEREELLAALAGPAHERRGSVEGNLVLARSQR
jgi:CheY-like chemotaxis protein